MFGVMVMVRVTTTQNLNSDPNPQNEIVEGHPYPYAYPEKKTPQRLKNRNIVSGNRIYNSLWIRSIL